MGNNKKNTKLNLVIDLGVMESLDLTIEEYSVASFINSQMTNPSNQMIGWSTYSTPEISSYLRLSRSTILRILKKLHFKGLVERYGKSQFIRTTQKWYDCTIDIPSVKLTPVMSDSTQSMQNLHTPFSPSSLTLSSPLLSPKNTLPSVKEGRLKKPSSCPLLNGSPLKSRYPNGHTECVEYLQDEEQKRGFGFINQPKQYQAIHKILKAGYGFDKMDRTIRKVEKKYGSHNWDYSTLSNWLEKGSAQDG